MFTCTSYLTTVTDKSPCRCVDPLTLTLPGETWTEMSFPRNCSRLLGGPSSLPIPKTLKDYNHSFSLTDLWPETKGTTSTSHPRSVVSDRESSLTFSDCLTFFTVTVGAQIPGLKLIFFVVLSSSTCGCKRSALDTLGDHVNTCTTHSGVTTVKKTNDWVVE